MQLPRVVSTVGLQVGGWGYCTFGLATQAVAHVANVLACKLCTDGLLDRASEYVVLVNISTA